jgi:hypothetical protein
LKRWEIDAFVDRGLIGIGWHGIDTDFGGGIFTMGRPLLKRSGWRA